MYGRFVTSKLIGRCPKCQYVKEKGKPCAWCEKIEAKRKEFHIEKTWRYYSVKIEGSEEWYVSMLQEHRFSEEEAKIIVYSYDMWSALYVKQKYGLSRVKFAYGLIKQCAVLRVV